ncbi:MAG: hypothetical protein OIF38_10560, partial [Cellvibrionaceae bacterium]|nr:hypothetical protein [Cellvibrionaceae bacterium]
MATTVSLKNALLIVGVLMSAQSSSTAAEQWSSINLLDENLARCLNIPPGAARRSIVSRLCVDGARTVYRVVVSDKRPES